MKFLCRILQSIACALIVWVSPIWSCSVPVDIHELVNDSSLVIVGKVTKHEAVIDTGTLTNVKGMLYTIKVNRVLYATPRIKRAVFSTGELGKINSALKDNVARKAVYVHVFERDESRPGEISTRVTNVPNFRMDKLMLFYLQVSKLLKDIPDTVVLYDLENLHDFKSEFVSMADLQPPAYFTVGFGEQSTWDLTETKWKNKLPTVEAFCEVMSIPNLCRREQKLRLLLFSTDKHLAANAAAALRQIEHAGKANQKPWGLEQKR